LLPFNGLVLFHYLGDEKLYIPFSHRNKRKNTDQAFVRTCPSTIEKIKIGCKTSTAKQVYRKSVVTDHSLSYQSVFEPKNYQQVENFRNKFLNQQRISRDSLYNVHAMAIDLPEFVHKIETHPDLLCICCHKEIMEEFDRVLTLQSASPQLLSYDTTFNLGDFYVSVLNFRHTLFIECPVVPAAFLIHERKFHEYHETFFKQCALLTPTLRKIKNPIVTDDEKGIVASIQKVLPNLKWLRCWNHLLRDVRRWLHKRNAPSKDVDVYISNLKKLFHKPSLTEYHAELEKMMQTWSAPYVDYYNAFINADVMSVGRWELEQAGLYNPYSGITNNQSEGLNHVLQSLESWHDLPLDCLMLSFYYLQGYYLSEISRGQNGLGTFHVHQKFKSCFELLPMITVKVYKPEEIVARIKGEIRETNEEQNVESTQKLPDSLSREARARKLIEDGKIVHNAQLKVFTISGSSGHHYVVTLHPKESCTCPAKKGCYHIIAAKMSIGIAVEPKQPTFVSLAQLRKNARISRKEKKSGSKKPREGDYTVIAAPDAKIKPGTNANKGFIPVYQNLIFYQSIGDKRDASEPFSSRKLNSDSQCKLWVV